MLGCSDIPRLLAMSVAPFMLCGLIWEVAPGDGFHWRAFPDETGDAAGWNGGRQSCDVCSEFSRCLGLCSVIAWYQVRRLLNVNLNNVMPLRLPSTQSFYIA